MNENKIEKKNTFIETLKFIWDFLKVLILIFSAITGVIIFFFGIGQITNEKELILYIGNIAWMIVLWYIFENPDTVQNLRKKET